YVESGETFTREHLDKILTSSIREIHMLRVKTTPDGQGRGLDPLILASLREDPTSTHEEALLKIYQRLRPGNPPQLEKARELFREKFQDSNRYRLGKVGRHRINRKFDLKTPETEMCLTADDFVAAIKHLLGLRETMGP